MASATLATGVLHQFLPGDFRVSPHWVYPAFLVLFLAVLVIGDPGRVDRQRPWLRATTGLMIALITVVNALAAGKLVVDILDHGHFETAGQLLLTGAVVWVINVIAFGLWFWDLDGGGAATRLARGPTANAAFVFPEMLNAGLVAPDWAPQFVDYLSLSFNTSTAFSPADVSPLKRWAKLLMMVEASISLGLVALVVSRAVNIL